MMRADLEHGLREVRASVTTLAAIVESLMDQASQALAGTTPPKGTASSERRIRELHMAIDQRCLELIATQQPVASDLRTVFTVMTAGSDLERIGHHARDIARAARRLRTRAGLAVPPDLAALGLETARLVHEAITAFLALDVETARRILTADDAIDAGAATTTEAFLAQMNRQAVDVAPSLALLRITHKLERIGDRVSNLAERTVFAVTGETAARPVVRDAGLPPPGATVPPD